MYSKVYSAAVDGIEGIIVQVEADVSDGLPMFDMVGYLASEVKEARERVKISLKNSGFHMKPKKITINLSPANIRKEGTAFDLPIAVSILTSQGFIPQDNLNQILIVGELSLNGVINPVRGILPIVLSAKSKGITCCLVPQGNAKEGAMIQGIDVIGVTNLSQVVSYLNHTLYLESEFMDMATFFEEPKDGMPDFSDISGQFAAKRAIEIAAAGRHHVIMSGTPGSGKTMIAKRIPSIMPSLTLEEGIELTKIYSVSGLLRDETLLRQRPFRAPHHTITASALAGGGRVPRPGEISLADKGVLFLDELPEFRREVIEVLRQPLEDKCITLSRTGGVYTYPADFMLVAALNPCSCGYYPDRNRCSCSAADVKRYLSRISGPLLDRIDIYIDVISPAYEELQGVKQGEASAKIRERVIKARYIQKKRYEQYETISSNGQLTPSQVRKFCPLGEKQAQLLKQAFIFYGFSARVYFKILKISRTIADLDESEEIKTCHLSEAIGYRTPDRGFKEELL